MNMHSIRNEDGWAGAFSREQASGAIPNGTRIVKCNSEPHDATPDGMTGTVLGSLRAPEQMGALLFYFVEWDDKPRIPLGIMATKIRAVS